MSPYLKLTSDDLSCKKRQDWVEDVGGIAALCDRQGSVRRLQTMWRK